MCVYWFILMKENALFLTNQSNALNNEKKYSFAGIIIVFVNNRIF